MNVKYPLIALLAILFSVHSYAQEETVKSTSLGITTNFDVFDEVSFGDQTNQFLLSLYVDNVIYPERRSNCYIQLYGGKQILKRLDLGFFTEFSRDYFFYNSNPSVETILFYEYVDVIGGNGVPAQVQKDWSKNYLSYALSLRYHLVVGKKIGLDLAFNPGMQTRFNETEQYEIERNEFDEEVVVLNEYNSRTTYRFFAVPWD